MATLISAQLFVFCIILASLFQLALAIGMPWGKLAMGGKFPGRLPPNMRVVAIVQMMILVLFGIIVLTKAGVILPNWFSLSQRLIWVVVAYSALGAILNVITPSKWERILWAPTTIVMLISSCIVAWFS
ncbi:MAG: hypothetical protein AAF702_32585 [Chloroflexota bacterium]